jgi:hypothetical protein
LEAQAENRLVGNHKAKERLKKLSENGASFLRLRIQAVTSGTEDGSWISRRAT